LLCRAVTCLDTFDGSLYQLLLSGSDDQTIKLWHIECAETDQAVKLQQMFDVVWDKNVPNPCIPLLAAVDNSNKLQVQFRIYVCGIDPGESPL
jgi:hypothetical protein